MEFASPTSLEIIAARRNKAIKEAESKTAKLHDICPELRTIDERLSFAAIEMLEAAPDGDKMEQVKDHYVNLRRRRNGILVMLGYPENYDAPCFFCKKCNDTGFIKLEKCSCLKELEAHNFMKKTVLGKGLSDYTFDTFSLEYCTDPSMKGVLECCKKYAENFTPDSGNLLLFGGTGLGKTHLAASIAHVAAGKGYYVVYESAHRIVSDCRKATFTSDADADEKYYKCHLLVIDDMGAEVKNEFSISALTSLIDSRIVTGLPTIISTNHDLPELNTIYGARLVSRLLGEYKPVRFLGKDVRMIKIK
jgi:DNA replication protein DnaC